MDDQLNNVLEIKYDDLLELYLLLSQDGIEFDPTQVGSRLNFENEEHMTQKGELDGVDGSMDKSIDDSQGLEQNNAQHELFLWRPKCT